RRGRRERRGAQHSRGPIPPRARRVPPDRRLRRPHAAGGGQGPQDPAPRPHLDGRGVRLRRARRVAGGRPPAPLESVLGLESGRRPAGARVLAHPPAPRAHHALVQQFRPLAVPREGDPALRHQRPRGPVAAALRRRTERPRLALRAGQLCGDRARAPEGPRGRGLQHRWRARGGEHRPDASDPPPPGQARDADPARQRPAGPRPTLRARLEEGPPARLDAPPPVRRRARGDRRLVPRARRLVAATQVRRVPRVLRKAVRAAVMSGHGSTRLGVMLALTLALPASASAAAAATERRVHPADVSGLPSYVARVAPAIVALKVRNAEGAASSLRLGSRRSGTGIIFDARGYVLTVSYLLLDAVAIEAQGYR